MSKLWGFFLFFPPILSYGQSITNVKAVQSGDNIVISYDLNYPNAAEAFQVSVFCSTDGGAHWGEALNHVQGDANTLVVPGKAKKITWMVLLERTELIGSNIQFEVRASKQAPIVEFSGNVLLDQRDNQSYPVIKVNGIHWMAENLEYKTAASTCYNNDENNCKKYGRLYEWDEAMNSCPEGWRLPSEKEWIDLETHLGLDANLANVLRWRGTDHGEKLKKGGSSGFDALYGGFKSDRGVYDRLGTYGYFWSATAFNESISYCRLVLYNNPAVYLNRYNKKMQMSVRCIRD